MVMTSPGHDSREERALSAFYAMRRKLDDALNWHLSRDAGPSAVDFQRLMPLARASQEGLRPRDLGREVDWAAAASPITCGVCSNAV